MNVLLRKTGPIDARISIPGSKSYTARALIAAALADGVTTLHHVSESDDSNILIAALKKLGLPITKEGTTVKISGWGSELPSITTTIDVGPAGTPARFLIALAAILPRSEITITGNTQMNARPVGPLVEALVGLGAQIEYLGTSGCPPVRITTGDGLTSTDQLRLGGSLSSQFFSALLLVAPALPPGLTITVDGTLTSQSYVAMTIQTIELFGATATVNPGISYSVKGTYKPVEYDVEADASGAMNLLGLAAVAGGSVTITNLPSTSLQGDMLFVEILERMGCKHVPGVDETTITSTGTLRGIDYDMNLLPDSALAAGVVAAFANGASTFSGLATLKHKESDRLQALSDQLKHIGAQSKATDDSILVQSSQALPTQTPTIETYDDHRVAMAFAIVAGKSDIIIEDAQVVTKSFPQFWDILEQCGVIMEESNT